jgi:hypothetical protein
MGYRPPKGVRPPQLEGKRTGRRKNAQKWHQALEECEWGYRHAHDAKAVPPTPGAALWQAFAASYLWDVHDYLSMQGVIK